MEVLMVVFLIHRVIRFPSDAVIHGQPPADLPVVLNVQCSVILPAVVTIQRSLTPSRRRAQHEVNKGIRSGACSVEGRQTRGVDAAAGPVVQLLAVNAATEPKLMGALDPVEVLIDR